MYNLSAAKCSLCEMCDCLPVVRRSPLAEGIAQQLSPDYSVEGESQESKERRLAAFSSHGLKFVKSSRLVAFVSSLCCRSIAMPFCGPKLSLVGCVLSAWGVAQLVREKNKTDLVPNTNNGEE
jgi:predicted phage tail protein